MKKTRRTGRDAASRDGGKVNAPRRARPAERGPQRIGDEALGEVTGGRDASTGQAVGRRIHEPIRVVTPTSDASAPQPSTSDVRCHIHPN